MELKHKHYKMEGNDIRRRESRKQDYFTVRLKERKHNELFRREHFTGVYVSPQSRGTLHFRYGLETWT